MGAPTNAGRRKARFIPKDENGDTLAQRWLFSPDSYSNGKLQSQTVSMLLIAGFIAFNASSKGHDFYDYLDDRFGEEYMNTWGMFIVTSVFYWAWAAVFAIPDLTGWPRCLYKYKTQPFTRVSGREYLSIAAIALRNQLLVALPLQLLKNHISEPNPVRSNALPSSLQTLATVFFDVGCTELGFYAVHRMFHSQLLYTHFHKQHHRFTAPVSLASTYCTITEHWASNIMPNLLGVLLVPHHWSQVCFTFLFLEYGTIVTHSGYNIPYLPNSLQHDFHHYIFVENFGPTGLLDNLLGTNQRFLETLKKAKQQTKGDEEKARKILLENLARMESEQSS